MVHFWSTRCVGCDADVDRYDALAERWKGKVNVVHVVGDPLVDVEGAVDQLGSASTVVADPRGRTAADYGMTETPATAFVTANGQILAREH